RDWSSDVCSSDLGADQHEPLAGDVGHGPHEVTVETVEDVQIGMQLMPRYTALQPLDGVLRRSLEGHPGHSPCSAEYGHTELAGRGVGRACMLAARSLNICIRIAHRPCQSNKRWSQDGRQLAGYLSGSAPVPRQMT